VSTVLGTRRVLLWTGAWALGIRVVPFLSTSYLMIPVGVLAALLALTRARRLLWIVALIEGLALLVIGCSPLVPWLARPWLRSDPLRPADAVVSLSAWIYPNGALDEHAQLRLLHAYELLGSGLAPRLVITRIKPPRPSGLPAVRRQVQQLGLRIPIDEVGPAGNTHDEALAVARLVRQRGWKRVILVSDPMHLRRAGAVFEAAGVPVCCSPAVPVGYSLLPSDGPEAHLAAFRDWLHEVIGYQVYRRRGWIR